MVDFKIACSLLNKFHPTIDDRPDAVEILNIAQARLNIVNYCTCLVGNRTVGCCAHTMTVLWYLSWGRFNDVSAPARFLDIFFEE